MTTWNAHICRLVPARTNRMAVVIALALAAMMPGQAFAQSFADTVFDIARFSTWPTNRGEGLSFRICLRDDDPAFGEFMALRGKSVHGRPVSLHALQPSEVGTQPCHVMYFSAGLATGEGFARLQDQAVLTVSPQQDFARAGGLVEIGRQDGKPTFMVDRKTVRDHSIQISSQMLALAREVDRP